MSLRRQLMLVSLLLLSLPWAGCQFVREMEGALRHGQEQSLQATAQAVAAALSDRPALLYPNTARLQAPTDKRASIYASPSREPVIVDGYADGWETRKPHRFVNEEQAESIAVSYQAVTRKERLYLLLRVVDSQVIYHNPGLSAEPNGDRLVLRTWENNRRQDYVIATAAPGKVRAKFASPASRGSNAGQISGQWQDSAQGYTLELEIPLSATGGRLGFYIINATGKVGEGFTTAGNISPLETRAPPWLIYTPGPLQQAINPFSQSGRQLDIVDRQRWHIAHGVAPTESRDQTAQSDNGTFWLLQVLYRSILSRDALATRESAADFGKINGVEIDGALAGYATNQRYNDPDYSTRTTLSTAAPILNNGEAMGAVLLSQSSEAYLSLTDQAFTRLLGYSLAAIGIGILGLLGYASILSWRIRSLSRAASEVAHTDGSILNNFPRSQANDEIGDLSRNYADLLDKLRQYNDYLRTLSRKLSHELRTPIAVIQTSLENLEQHREKTAEDDIYLSRAKGGLSRLGKILNAMSEASGLEESIRNNRKTPLDLVPLLREIFAAYQGVYTDHQLTLDCEPERAITVAAPDLLVQALDKFMDNAASFCPSAGTIALQLRAQDGGWRLAVINDGPTLPREMQGQLFNSMVCVRERGSDGIHLGLGLHIVQLIAEFHGARADIKNRADGSGVCSTLTLRASSETPSA